jgi:hypothetical protein
MNQANALSIPMPYKVFIDDNFHYAEAETRIPHGEFETLSAAIAACQKIVDEFLASAYEPGMTAKDLNATYVMFGDDPWIFGAGSVPFSGRDYARERCVEICQRGL